MLALVWVYQMAFSWLYGIIVLAKKSIEQRHSHVTPCQGYTMLRWLKLMMSSLVTRPKQVCPKSKRSYSFYPLNFFRNLTGKVPQCCSQNLRTCELCCISEGIVSTLHWLFDILSSDFLLTKLYINSCLLISRMDSWKKILYIVG